MLLSFYQPIYLDGLPDGIVGQNETLSTASASNGTLVISASDTYLCFLAFALGIIAGLLVIKRIF